MKQVIDLQVHSAQELKSDVATFKVSLKEEGGY